MLARQYRATPAGGGKQILIAPRTFDVTSPPTCGPEPSGDAQGETDAGKKARCNADLDGNSRREFMQAAPEDKMEVL